jgi:dihydroxy-acid dehydratase
VKTAGVDESILNSPARPGLRKPGRRRQRILTGKVKEGDVVVIRYEGPRGGPGMQEMLYPTQLPEVEGAGQGLRADHRRPLLGRHLGPVHRPRLARKRRKAALIGLVEDGDTIEIDIPNRRQPPLSEMGAQMACAVGLTRVGMTGAIGV